MRIIQTFLPYPNFSDSALVLDRQRLGKQRIETYQIMITLCTGRGWVHHPAVKMWVGYERSLLDYQEAVIAEWVSRGYKDTCWGKTLEVYQSRSEVRRQRRNRTPPFWLGNVPFHISHQSNLVKKDREYYQPKFPFTPDDLEYVWPV